MSLMVGASFALLLVLCLTAIWFYCYSIYAGRDLFSQGSRENTGFYPPVSILKPICGLDDDTYANLASFCRQDYPRYQIIFGARNEEDPAMEVARKIMEDFPRQDIQLIVCGVVHGTSPKVSNLQNMVGDAKYPLLLIADSDIRVQPDYLKRVVLPLENPAVGAVTCMHRSLSRGLKGAIEALRISTDFCAGVLVARKMEGMKFALGSTILVRGKVFDAIGGFKALADHLDDDFMLGHLVEKAGYTVVLSDYVVEHALPNRRLSDFIRREIRWNRGSRTSRPWGYRGLIFTYGVPMSLFFLLLTRGSLMGWAVLGATWIARLSMGHVVGHRYLKDAAAKKHLWLVPLVDLLSFALWVFSFQGDEILWRGRRFKVTTLGKLIPVPETRQEGIPLGGILQVFNRWLREDLLSPVLPMFLGVFFTWALWLDQGAFLMSDPLALRASPSVRILELTETDRSLFTTSPPELSKAADPQAALRPKWHAYLLAQLRAHLDVIAVASTFGIAVLTERVSDGKGFHFSEDIKGPTQAAFLAATTVTLWGQQPTALSFASAYPLNEGTWKFQMQPTLLSNRPAVLAVFRRKF